MVYLSENLKSLRKARELTQEDIAGMLGISPQSVSKWERGETLPDITLLPQIANLFRVSIDVLLGMDRINGDSARQAVFAAEQAYMRDGDYSSAVDVLKESLLSFPNDRGFTSELAMALALTCENENIARAASLCERVLSEEQGSKVGHTSRAALCLIYWKLGEHEKAVAEAKKLPHIRESRESVLAELEASAGDDTHRIDEYLRLIALGE